MEQSQFSNSYLLKLLGANGKIIFIVALLSGIAAAFFSSSIFITPKFKSTAVLYPSNISPYSNESQTEQMVQLLQSADIRNKVIGNLDLFKHYHIDINNPQKNSYVTYVFTENVSISKTEFESIEINVLDEDPAMAVKIVEKLISYTDEKIRNIHKQKSLEVVEVNRQIFSEIKNQIDSVDSLIRVYHREYGLLDYYIQTKEAQKYFFKSVEKNNQNLRKESNKLLTNLGEHGHDFIFLADKAAALRRSYGVQVEEYFKSLRDYQKVFTYNNIISKPIVSDKKAYPVRWIIVSMSMLSSVFLCMILLLFFRKNNLE
jgi:capsular polysaccharide biosynthesis protein